MPEPPLDPSLHRKATTVAVTVITVIAISGYFMGLRQVSNTGASRALSEIVHHDDTAPEHFGEVPAAPDYLAVHQMAKANHKWTNTLQTLRQSDPNPAAVPAEPPTTAQRAAAVEERAAGRAYEGAPPTIPHPIDPISAQSCLACHADGKVIKGRVASRVSHPHFSNCTQCHVRATN